ncbi:MAG TPA: cupin domain-containing protein [Burkholderiales bacterium]|nr:cupin domain-containing protein [Burkholderiales bacterium]
MAIVISEDSVGAEPLGPRVERRRLLTGERVKDTRVLLERRNLAAGAAVEIAVPAASLVWLQILEGEVVLRHSAEEEPLSPAHIVFLPPRFRGTLASPAGAALLHAEVPDAARFDPNLSRNPPPLRVVDWTREPVLDSKHDRRKRIYVLTPALFDTTAIKGEMIIYPPGTQAANHHHEGAEHFMYFTRGRGTAWANESPFAVKKGDLVYYGERERHYLKSEGSEDMVFVEFFVPGKYKTIWAPGAAVCTWLPTGRDIRGRIPARDIAAHSSAAAPQDV